MRREGKEVQSFFFLMNEHISPGAEEERGAGDCRGGGYVWVMDRGRRARAQEFI